jgi:transcriptional regulator with XRE-family HTH domain
MKRERAHVSQAAIAKLAGVTKQSVQAFEASARRRKYKSAKRDAIIGAYAHLDELRPYTDADLLNGRWLARQVDVFLRESAFTCWGVPEGMVLLSVDALHDLGRRIITTTRNLAKTSL